MLNNLLKQIQLNLINFLVTLHNLFINILKKDLFQHVMMPPQARVQHKWLTLFSKFRESEPASLDN
jgi:hypothetical protein